MSLGRFIWLLGFGVGLCILSAMVTRLVRRAWLVLFPELLLLEQPEDRRKTFWRTANNASTNRWQIFLGIAMFAVIVLGPAAIARACPQLTADERWWAWFSLSMGAIAVCFLAPPWITRRVIRQSLRRVLLDRGIAVCPHCGCDMRGRAESACPRCGSPSEGASPAATPISK